MHCAREGARSRKASSSASRCPPRSSKPCCTSAGCTRTSPGRTPPEPRTHSHARRSLVRVICRKVSSRPLSPPTDKSQREEHDGSKPAFEVDHDRVARWFVYSRCTAAGRSSGPGVPLRSVLPGVGTSCPTPPQTQSQGTQPAQVQAATTRRPFSASTTATFARALATEVNRIRRKHGLRPLLISAQLASAGTAHAHSLAASGQFTHAWPSTGKFFGSWIRDFYPARGFRSWSAGENLLWASPGFAPTSAV